MSNSANSIYICKDQCVGYQLTGKIGNLTEEHLKNEANNQKIYSRLIDTSDFTLSLQWTLWKRPLFHASWDAEHSVRSDLLLYLMHVHMDS